MSSTSDSAPVLRPATVDDAPAIRAIYNVEVERYTSTFDLVPRSLDAQRQWLADRSGAFAAVVAELDGAVVGFGSLSPYKERAAYRPTVEDSVYVDREQARRGIGRALLTHIVDDARQHGFHSVMARIEATTVPSIKLHEACGFEIVGTERQVGRKFGKWLDVVSMQLML
ncbi:MAG: N-acetyltransferase family protein [Actinomycetota bacterium]